LRVSDCTSADVSERGENNCGRYRSECAPANPDVSSPCSRYHPYYGHTVRGLTPGHTGFHLIRGTSVSRQACPALRQPRCISLSLTAGAARPRRPWLSPWGWPVVTIRPSFAATGRGWRHPTFTCRRPAPWKARRWLKLQGDCCAGYRRAASNGADREAGLKAPDPASPDPHGGLPRAGGLLTAVAQNRRARVPKGSPIGAGNRPRKMVAE
jgi:hypothetical protein